MMNREEILKRNKENKVADEGEQYIEMKSRNYGMLALCVLFIILVMINLIKKRPILDISVLFWSCQASSCLYKYKLTKNKEHLISGILFTIATLTTLAAYIIEVW